MTVLVDHDLEGYALLIWGVLISEGWSDLIELLLTTFSDQGLPVNSKDRVVWRHVQAHGMLLLTGNRNMDDEDSLEQTMRDECTPTSLPVVTVGNTARLAESSYRTRCARSLVDLVLRMDQYLGVPRVYVPD